MKCQYCNPSYEEGFCKPILDINKKHEVLGAEIGFTHELVMTAEHDPNDELHLEYSFLPDIGEKVTCFKKIKINFCPICGRNLKEES